MPYVKRDEAGKVTAVFAEPQTDASEFVEAGSAEIKKLLAADGSDGDTQRDLLETDLAMGRVVEDLIDVLIEKNVILLTDLPAAAQQKLMSRRNLRGRLSNLVDLVDEVGGV